MGLHQSKKIPPEQGQHLAITAGTGLRGPRRIVEQSQFAEKITHPEAGDRAIGLRFTQDADLAGKNEVKRLPFLALIEDHLIALVLPVMHQAGENAQFAPTEIGKERERGKCLEMRRLRSAEESVKH